MRHYVLPVLNELYVIPLEEAENRYEILKGNAAMLYLKDENLFRGMH